jgi:hypothetical protein
MEGIPIAEISKRLDISNYAVKMRLSRRGIQPIGYVGTAGLYKEEVIDLIRDILPRGKRSPKWGKDRQSAEG